MAEIYITGYPRSGSSWSSQLIGDILNCPVGGLYNAEPLCTEGQDRPSEHKVCQLHLKPVHRKLDSVIPNAYAFCVELWDGEPIIHIVRDPRDVAVSAQHYWKRRTLQEALDALAFGEWPLKTHGPWSDWVGAWLDIPVYQIRYEDLHYEPGAIITEFLDRNSLIYDPDRVDAAIQRQSFKVKLEQVRIDGDSRPYGINIQKHHMHKGKTGSWKRRFTPEQQAFAKKHFGEVAERLGYTL